MEQKYVEHINNILPQDWKWFLVTLDFADDDRTMGPPFSTNPSRIQKLFADIACMQLLHEEDIIDSEPRFKSKGLDCLWERVQILSPIARIK